MAPKNLIDIDLYRAAASTQNEEFRNLLRSKGISDQELMSYKTPNGNTLLHIASLKGNNHVVSEILLHVRGSISEKNFKSETSLQLAARSGSTEVVAALLVRMKKRAEKTTMSATDRKGNTAAHEAVMNGHHQTIKLLMDYHPGDTSYLQNEILTILNSECVSPLYVAVKAGMDVELVGSMLDHADKNKLAEAGKPLLYPAIMRRNTEMFNIILEKAPELIHMRDGQGRMAIHYAASIGYHDAVDSLINKDGSCVMERDNDGLFPVHLATRNGHIKVLKKLLEDSPDQEELVTNRGRTILHEAAVCGKHDVVKYILNDCSLRRLINQQDDEGNTPLHLATMKCKAKVVSIMTWNAEVNLCIVNDAGKTVVDIAEDNINEDPNKFLTRLTWHALKSAGGTKASRDVIPKPRQNKRAGGETSRSNDKFKPSINMGFEEQQQEVPPRSDSQNINGFKDRANTLTLVATLIATVTFAAGFTVPGGYDPTTGVPIFLHHKMFSVFIFCNSVALYCSIIVVVSLIWAQLGDVNLIASALTLALPSLVVALTMMLVAFMIGTYTYARNWLGVVALALGGVFVISLLLLILPLCLSLDFKNPVLRRMNYYPFHLLVLLTSDRHIIEDRDAETF